VPILCLTGVLMLITMAAAFVGIQTRYTTRAIIYVARKTGDDGQFLSAVRAQIKSKAVLGKAAERAGIADLAIMKSHSDPIEWLQRELVVERFGTGVRVSISGTAPADNEKLVNAVVSAYVGEMESKERKERREFQKTIAEGIEIPHTYTHVWERASSVGSGFAFEFSMRMRPREIADKQVYRRGRANSGGQ
jgi:hypothetical protein